jgi:hypothetical protein
LEQVPMLLQVPLVQAPPGQSAANEQSAPGRDPPTQTLPHCESKLHLAPGLEPPRQDLPHCESKLQAAPGVGPLTQDRPH